ncbi:MAG: insulinase family protein [Flavobacteriales bacterium]|jgi:predicted Zn-dependent peptidase|nr:insulinase family protein [Flavobacteriales bacterium]
MLDRTIAPSTHKISSIPFPEPEKKVLSNGIPVHGFNIGSQEVVQIELVLKSGQKHDHKPLAVSAMANLVGEASQKYSPGKIIELIDYYGAFYESSCDGDKIYFALFTLTKHLDQVLPIFAEAILNPTFPERETNIYLKNSQQNFLTSKEKTSFICRKNFNALLFKDHPYGRMINEDDYDLVHQQDLINYHTQYLNAQNCEFFISGKYEDSLYQQLDSYFSEIPSSNFLPQQFDQVIRNDGGKHFITKKDAIQSGIRIGKVLDVNFGSEDFFKLKVLNTIFGGYFGSRLMSNIREDKGYTYGIGSGIAAFEDASYFFISTEVGKAVTADAVAEIYKELNIITSEKVAIKELDTVKNYMLGSLLKESDGVFSIADRFKGVYFKGESFDFYNRYMNTINQVTPSELLETAQKHFNTTNLLEVIAGDKHSNE